MFLAAVFLLLLGYVLLKLFQLWRADGDLTVMGSSMKPEYYKDRVVWVTGASSGIGEELCYLLSQMGAKLILSGRNEAKLEEVKNKLSHPEHAQVLPVDLSDPEAARNAAEKAKNLFGRVDILVNNAGISTRDFFVNFEEQAHRRVMEVNFFAPWILTHCLIKDMIQNGFGHVVSVSSFAGKFGVAHRSSYCSAKFAVVALMDTIRHEMQGNNIFVTNILPGPVRTNVSVNALQGDGSQFGETDNFIANGMSAKRCAELCLVGISNQQREIWVSNQPYLLTPYLAHYCPSLLHLIVAKKAREALDAAKKQN